MYLKVHPATLNNISMIKRNYLCLQEFFSNAYLLIFMRKKCSSKKFY